MQVLDGALAGLLFIEALTRVTILGLVVEHGIDDAGELVGGGSDSFGSAETGTHGAAETAQGALGMGESLGGDAEGGGTGLGLLGFDDLTASDIIMGTKAEPGGEMLDRIPPGHIETDL